MRTLAIRHVGFEHLDLLEDLLGERGHDIRSVSYTHLRAHETDS